MGSVPGGIDLGPVFGPLLPTLAVPLLVLLFYFDGMVIGKFLPPAAFFVSYVALLRPSPATLLPVSVACVVASTLGQWTLYRGLNDETRGTAKASAVGPDPTVADGPRAGSTGSR